MEPKQITFHTHSEKNDFLNTCLAELRSQNWSEKDVFAVHSSLDEALVNALRHGNQENQSKKVSVTYLIEQTTCSFEITDEGNGFNPNSLPDPTALENLERPCGRGVFLIRHYMDRVVFNQKGNSIWIKKDIA